MINSNMRIYDYFTLGAENEYGQAQLSSEPVGKIKMAIETSSQQVQDNILYKSATYIGLTQFPIDDSFVVSYGSTKLKVLYVNTKGRYKQAYMAEYVN